MSMMYQEIVIVLSMAVITRLLVFKFDQDCVSLLEGKLFKQKRDTVIAKLVYRSHKRVLSVIFFVIGGAGIGTSVILLSNGHRLFPLSVGVTITLLGLGIWGRISAFRAADRELSRTELR